jgi:hypothetical protein
MKFIFSPYEVFLSAILLILVGSGGSICAETIPSKDVSRAVQIELSLRTLTDNESTSQRGQIWIMFLSELYKKRPNLSAENALSLFQIFTNEYSKSVSSRFMDPWSTPPEMEIYRLMTKAAQKTDFAQDVALAIQSVRVSMTSSRRESGALTNIVSNTDELQMSLPRFDSAALVQRSRTAIGEALKLADANTRFRDAYIKTVTPVTKVTPGDTARQMFDRVEAAKNNPTVKAIAALLDQHGDLRINKEDLQKLFTGDMDRFGTLIGRGIDSLRKEAAATPGMPDYLSTALAPSGYMREEPRNQTEVAIRDLNLSVNLIGSFIGRFDPVLGKQIDTVSQSATQIAKAINGFDLSNLAGTLASSTTKVVFPTLRRSWFRISISSI